MSREHDFILHCPVCDGMKTHAHCAGELRAQLAAAERERDAEYKVRKYVIHAIEGQGLPPELPDNGWGVITDAHSLYEKWQHEHTRAERTEKALRLAAGMISTLPEWSDKHPQDAYDWIVAQSEADSNPTP